MPYSVKVPSIDDEQQRQQQQQQLQQEQDQQARIYLVTEGLKSPDTKRSYCQAFDHFIKTTVKNDNLRVLLDTKQNVIESKIIDHITYLNDVQHLSHGSIQVHLSGIFHFFEINDINLNTRKIMRFLPEDEYENISNDRPYSVKEIEQILAKCDIRSRVMVLLMASTGMRIGGLRELCYGNIKKIDEFGLYKIWVYARSRPHRYYTFCTPSCAAAVDAYLDYRRNFDEKIEDKSPLIREQFNIDNPFTIQAPKFISLRMMSFIFADVLKRSGVNQVKPGNEKREIMTSHGFRKFFINQSEKANLNYTTWKCLAGHKLKKTDASYKRSTEEDILAEYVRAIPFLEIDSNQKLKTRIKELETERDEKMAQQDQEIFRLKTQICKMNESNRSEVLTLKAQFNEINEKLNRIDLVDLQSFPLEKFPSDYTIHNLLEENGIDYKQHQPHQQQQKKKISQR